MKMRRRSVLASVLVSGLLVSVQGRAQTPLSAEQIGQIVASPDRSSADRTNDLRRKPEPMLAFIGVRPGMVALDLSAAGGYTTELLARAVGPSGVVYGQSPPPRDPNRAPTPAAAPEGNSNPTIVSNSPPAPGAPRPSAVALAERDQRLQAAGIPAARMAAVSRPFENPIPPDLVGRLDLVTLMFNYHDLGHL